MEALLQQFREKYGTIFAAQINHETFVFRELSRKEYKDITKRQYPDEYQVEEIICQAGVLHPEDYDFSGRGRAGVAKILAAQIIAASGFAHRNQQIEMLEYFRAGMNDFDAQAETVIGLVFPNVSDEDMENWTQERFMKKLARAEWVMQNIWGMPYKFGERDEGEEEAPETEPPTLKEIGDKIREQGGDPMIVLKDQLISDSDRDYVQFPMIGGTKLLANEEALNNVRKQIQGLPRER